MNAEKKRLLNHGLDYGKDYSCRLLNHAVIRHNCNVTCALQNQHKFTVKTAVDTCVLNVHKSYTLI